MVSDKEIGGRQGYGRLIPLCNFVVQEMEKFIQFLDFLKFKSARIIQKFKTIFNRLWKTNSRS